MHVFVKGGRLALSRQWKELDGLASELLMFSELVMQEDCVIISNMFMPEKGPRICVLMEDGYPDFDPGYYLGDRVWEKFIMSSPVLETLRTLKEQNAFDVYLNLCEGYEKPHYSGLDVVRALEILNLPFTGSDSRFYEPTREDMQAAAEACGVGFVNGVNVSDVGAVETLTAALRYPLMVKHPNSYGSTGMTRKSRVENVQELKQQVRRICDRFGSARVEEFIDGLEFTAFVVDNPDDFSRPFVYPPAELRIPEGESFLHSGVKWNEYVHLERVRDEPLADRMKDMTRRLYLSLNGVGYARTDIRMNEAGELYVLEINPNSGILYKPEDLGPADVMMDFDGAGHDGFLDRIFRSAMLRHYERSLNSKSPGGG